VRLRYRDEREKSIQEKREPCGGAFTLINMSHDLRGSLRPRPIRVAFLIQEGEHAHLALDGIFADCYSRWGGRFSLIVPCTEGRIMPSYWPWLEAYDPDIVYSYVTLNRTDILEIHERLSPAHYKFHKLSAEPRLDVFGFKPDYKFPPLSSLSTLFKLARYRPIGNERAAIRIMDRWYAEKPTRFFTDNFGTYYRSGNGMYPSDAMSAANLLTVVSTEKKNDRRFGVPQNLDDVPTEFAAFNEFALKRATSISLISALFATKLDIDARSWSSAFNLVVGNSFADRILFWNARLFIPAWHNNDMCCFRVDMEQLKHPEFLTILGNLLKNRNYVNDGGGGQSHAAIRSISLTKDDLAEAQQLIQSTKPWGWITTEAVTGLEAMVPDSASLQNARESVRFGNESSRPDWADFNWSPPSARPPAVAPDHLSDAPVRQSFTQGYWCTDFSFEYDGSGTGPHFVRDNQWVLPRRWRMANAFNATWMSAPHYGLPPTTRRSRDGQLAVFLCTDRPIESIEIPNADKAMHYALAADGRWAKADAEHELVYPPHKVAWAMPSNEARYFNGVLGMAGGCKMAEAFLLHPFLIKVFASLGGTPNQNKNDITPTVNRLQKLALSQPAFDLKNENERQALANLIVKAGQGLKNPLAFVRYDRLKEQWKEHRQAYWQAHPEHNDKDSDGEWDKHEEDSLDACLIDLRKRQMLFQGHYWSCKKCHHKNWVDLNALASELSCEVCKQVTPAPINIEWLFRPNEFLIESLRDHSVLSLIWALSALRQRADRSFIFVKPTWFGLTEEATRPDAERKPDAEADLLVLLDGQALLCEIKSSWHSLRISDIDDLVMLALRLRPDVALLGVMEKDTGPTVKLEAAKQQLATAGIKFEVLRPTEYDFNDDPYLPSYWNSE
jgi:hypothetical protein